MNKCANLLLILRTNGCIMLVRQVITVTEEKTMFDKYIEQLALFNIKSVENERYGLNAIYDISTRTITYNPKKLTQEKAEEIIYYIIVENS